MPASGKMGAGSHEPRIPLPKTAPNKRLQPTAYSVSSVRRASGMEECGNTLGVQAPNEPLELSIIDHSMV